MGSAADSMGQRKESVNWKKREKTEMINIRTKTGDATTDPAGIQRTVREYYKKLYTHVNSTT